MRNQTLAELYQQLETCESCLDEDIRENESIGIDFYTRAIQRIRDEIDRLETERLD